jgi:hypothetical protein
MTRTRASVFTPLILAVFLIGVVAPQPALAAPCTGAQIIHLQAVPGTNGRGARSTSMVTFNAAVTCAHISSIGDRSTSGNGVFTEAGWLENPAGLIICGTTSGVPKWFVFWVVASGAATCVTGSNVGAGSTHSYAVRDNEQDGIWNLVFDNVTQATPNMGTFVTGQPIANGERRVSSDPGIVDIKGLQRMDSTASWVSWTNTSGIDNDPGFLICTTKFPTELLTAVMGPC